MSCPASRAAFYSEEEIKAGKCELELELAQATGRFEEEGWRYRKDGSRMWASSSSARSATGRPLIGYSKVTRDLSERRRARIPAPERAALPPAGRQHPRLRGLHARPAGLRGHLERRAERIKGYPRRTRSSASTSRSSTRSRTVRAGNATWSSPSPPPPAASRRGLAPAKGRHALLRHVIIRAIRNEQDYLLGFSQVDPPI